LGTEFPSGGGGHEATNLMCFLTLLEYNKVESLSSPYKAWKIIKNPKQINE
jgi:hypothetical protein